MSRYIDADLLKDDWQENNGNYMCVEDAIDIQPTADVRENVRGEWQRMLFNGDTDYVRCSNCGMDFEYINGVCYLVAKNELPNFCPNCGADMRHEKC